MNNAVMDFNMEKASFGEHARVAGKNNTLAPFFMMSGNQESLGGSGNISLKCYNSKLFSLAEPSTLTLPKGLQDGQLKKLQLVHKGTEGAYVTVNCPSLIGSNSTMVFTNIGDTILLAWTGRVWCVLETGNTTDPTLQTPQVL